MRAFLELIINALKIVLILEVVMVLISIFSNNGIDWESIKWHLFYNAYYGFPLSIINGFYFDQLDEKLSWDDNAKLRAWAGFLGSVIITMFSIFFLNYILWVSIWGNDFSILFTERNRNFYIIGLVITVIISSILHALFFFKRIQEQKAAYQKLEEKHLSSQLNALRSQLDPHFLFNSFNVLSGLIEEDTEKAQYFLAGLSKIYRYVLEQRNEVKSSVKEELDFAKRYLELFQARFEDSILLNIDVEHSILSKKIPSLSLQLLLENAIKHNAFDSTNPLSIDITSKDDDIIISNNIIEKRKKVEGEGIGLHNIFERYKILTDLRPEVFNSSTNFSVKLPTFL